MFVDEVFFDDTERALRVEELEREVVMLGVAWTLSSMRADVSGGYASVCCIPISSESHVSSRNSILAPSVTVG